MTADRAQSDFAAEAEARREQGDAIAAVRIAEAGLARTPDDLRGRIALALARIDLGDVLQARDELAAVLRPAATAHVEPASPGVDAAALESVELQDDELETAFAQAESDPDEMMDANRVVEQTLRAAELDSPEPDFDFSSHSSGSGEPDGAESGFDLSSHPTYATESMAALLDSQGRRAEALALRESLSAGAGRLAAASPIDDELPEPGPTDWDDAAIGPDHTRRLRVVATLEGWLYNLRRGAENDARAGARGGTGGTA